VYLAVRSVTVSAPEGWVEITDARDDIEAQLILGTLRDAGIEAQSLKTNTAPGAWLTGTQVPWSPAAILAPEEQAAEARELLSLEGDGGLRSRESVDHAPEPVQLAGPRRSGRVRLVWLVAIFLLLAFVVSLLTDMRDIIGV
jgi:Putative prokaryotic signal transducing protein